jgi:hypothetical protein
MSTGRLTLTPVLGRVWSTTLPGLVSGFRSLLLPAEGLPHVITVSSHPLSESASPERGARAKLVLHLRLGFGPEQQVWVLPPFPNSWTTRVRSGVSVAQPTLLVLIRGHKRGCGTSIDRGSRVTRVGV